VTPRTLLSLIRLAQAHAKLRFSNEVSYDDIKEAIALMEGAKS
jgi:DNA replicative helicase MCM subunit Mcm2 (Cdc46/Mcm family)